MDSLQLTPPIPPRTTEMHRMEAEMLVLREEKGELHEQVGRQETELNKLRAQLGSIREERDRLKRKVGTVHGKLYTKR